MSQKMQRRVMADIRTARKKLQVPPWASDVETAARGLAHIPSRVLAALAYASDEVAVRHSYGDAYVDPWPFASPDSTIGLMTPRDRLLRAAALLAAEIECIDAGIYEPNRSSRRPPSNMPRDGHFPGGCE